MKQYLHFNNLKKFDNIIHGVFDKSFGNISFKYGSKKEVLKNRKRIAQMLNIKVQNIYEMDQVHGSDIKILRSEDIKKLENNIVPKTDGLITNEKNIFLMIKTADCFPVAIYDKRLNVISAIHVGASGLEKKIIEKTIKKMQIEYGSKPKDILVAIGPGIRDCCYKFSKINKFTKPIWSNYLRKKGKVIAVNTFLMLKDQLIESGINKQNMSWIENCTSCSQNFYSHYRSRIRKEKEGNFCTIIGLKL